jgi:hypothetical protein
MEENNTAVRVDRVPLCDYCTHLGVNEPAKYDAKTSHGPWAFMCQRHFDMYGGRLGLGLGQKLKLRKRT